MHHTAVLSCREKEREITDRCEAAFNEIYPVIFINSLHTPVSFCYKVRLFSSVRWGHAKLLVC